ncbi:MAG: alcohol dehydrogenase catalytic domain-containing protein [Aggregatilineales bacterium]
MTNTMTAVVYYGPKDLRVEEIPLPQITPDEILIKVHAANICGTDIRIYKGEHSQYPKGTKRIPGHEVVGEIVQMGERITGYSHGQRVFIAPNMGHGTDRNTISGNNNMDPSFQALGITMDGAFAEYMRIPTLAIQQGNLMPIHDHLDAAVAALIEPFACVLRGQNAINVHYGDVVLVIGAGPIGILHLMLANLRGAVKVIVSDPNANRRNRALLLGADAVIDPTQDDVQSFVDMQSEGRGADAIIVAAPSKSAQESVLDLAAIRGRINFFGGLPKHDPFIRFNSNTVHYRELVVTGTTACSTYDCLQALDLVNSDRVDLRPIITSRYALADAVDAFSAAMTGGDDLRIALEP